MSVAEAVAALGESYMPVGVGRPPVDVTGEIWDRFTDAAAPATLAHRLDVMTPDYEDDAGVATAFLCSRLASPLALLAGRPVVSQRRGLVVDPERLWLRRHVRGWFNGIVMEHVRVLVLPGDPLAGERGSEQEIEVVDDLATLREWSVRGLADTMAIVLDRLATIGHLGRRALWGQFADALVTHAARPHDATGDADTARAEAAALLATDDRLWVEPTIARVEVDGAVGLAWRRGSCCLAYRCERYDLCTGCPLTPTDEWWQRSVDSVRQRAGGAA